MCAVTRVMMQQLIRLKILPDAGEAFEIGANLLSIQGRVGADVTEYSRKKTTTQGALTVGAIGVDGVPILPNRFFWWPAGFVSDSLVGVVSSRLDRQPEGWGDWFCALRSICAHLDSDSERLIVAEGTTTAIYAERAAELFGKRTLQICVEPKRSLESWWRFVQQSPSSSIDGTSESTETPDASLVAKVHVSPPVGALSDTLPARDSIVHALAQRLVALHVAPHGNIFKLMGQRLSSASIPKTSTRLLLSERTAESVTDQLLGQGCVGWHLKPRARSAIKPTKIGSEAARPKPPLLDSQSTQQTGKNEPGWSVNLEAGQWLTHCTRRRVGPWPNQTAAEHIDDLLFDQPAADHSPLSALTRIVSQARLIASHDGVRGSAGVVCFTAVNLSELSSLRVFRPHRGRWDFEPYGVCVSKRWLVEQGARAVRYATSDEFQSISKAEQPYFQLQASRTRGGNAIDWTVEEEWRVVGDLELASAGPDEIVVFAPTEREATILRDLGKWRVIHQVG